MTKLADVMTAKQVRDFCAFVKTYTSAGKDGTGEQFYVHKDDGPYVLTANYGRSWVEYEVIDDLDRWLNERNIRVEVEPLSDYEIGVVSL